MNERGNEFEQWPSRFVEEPEEPSPLAPNPHDPIAVFAHACINHVGLGKCGAYCCGVHTMPVGFYEQHQEKAYLPPTGLMETEIGVNVLTADMLCVFLHRVSKRCSIYKDRPRLCRQFGTLPSVLAQCPYLNPDGTVRTRAQHKRFVRARDREAAKVMREAKDGSKGLAGEAQRPRKETSDGGEITNE